MLLPFSTTSGLFSGAIGTAIPLVGRNPDRKSLLVSFNPTTTVGRIWINATDVLTTGINISTTPPMMLLTTDNVGLLLYEAWFFDPIAGGAVNGVWVDTINIDNIGSITDATRIKPASGNDWEYKWGIFGSKRRTDGNSNILTPDNTLYDIIRRRRRFR